MNFAWNPHVYPVFKKRILGAVCICIYAQSEKWLGSKPTQHARLLPNLVALRPAHRDGQQHCETIEHKKL